MVEIDTDGSVRFCKPGTFATRQESPLVYELDSAVYAWRWETLREHQAVILPGSRVYVMPRERSIDIDEELDLRIAECLMSGIHEKGASGDVR